MVMTPPGFRSDLHAGHEIVQIGDLRQDVVADDEIRRQTFGAQSPRGLEAEETRGAGYASGDCDLRDIGGRLDAQHGNALRDEVLQQVAVVARELDHEAGLIEAEAGHDHVRVRLGVLDPCSEYDEK